MSIKEKIKQWLFKEELQKLDTLEYHYKALYNETFECNKNLNVARRQLEHAYDLCGKIQRMISDDMK